MRSWFGLSLVLLGALFPVLGYAQAPTVTITPKLGAGQKVIFNNEKCAAQNETVSAYSVVIDFTAVGAPLPGTKFDVELGRTCDDNDDSCQTILNDQALNQVQTSTDINLSLAQALDAIAEAGCEDAVDERLKLFVTVIDSLGTQVATGTSKDNESVFVDTILPEPPLNPSAKGGENNLTVSWESNSANDGDGFVLGAQETGFQVQCRLAGSSDAFVDCGGQSTGFSAVIEELNGEELVNGVGIEFGVITIDPANNQSVLSATATATPQDVLDFGENYGGGELGGCSTSQGDASFGVVLLVLLGLFVTRRSARPEGK